MQDPTENIRREMVAEINAAPGTREWLEQTHGRCWDTDQLRADFEVIGFMAPFVVAKSRLTGKKGSLMFQHSPRFYFNWQEEAV